MLVGNPYIREEKIVRNLLGKVSKRDCCLTFVATLGVLR